MILSSFQLTGEVYDDLRLWYWWKWLTQLSGGWGQSPLKRYRYTCKMLCRRSYSNFPWECTVHIRMHISFPTSGLLKMLCDGRDARSSNLAHTCAISLVKARRRQAHLYSRPAWSPSSACLSWWLRFQSRHLHQSQCPNKEKKNLNFRTLKKLNFMLFSFNVLFCTDERAALSKLM